MLTVVKTCLVLQLKYNTEIPTQRKSRSTNAEASCSISSPEFVKANLNPLTTRKNLSTQEFKKTENKLRVSHGSGVSNRLKLLNFENL